MFILLLAMLAAPSTLPPTASANAVVVQPVANMYSRATTDADVVSQALYGVNVHVLESAGTWMRIQTPDHYQGWMQASAALKRAPYAQDAKATVQAANLFASVYRETNITKHQPIVTVPFETLLETTGTPAAGERWLQVVLPDGRRGWMQRGDVTEPHRMSMAEMVAFSERFVGLPYLWGGTSTFGYDCSGFTQMLYRRLGVLMPRDADQQAAWSELKPVARAELRPGDLLYFGASQNKITHTGMYIGDGAFINATAHDKPVVQICKLADEHWTRLFVAARRLK